MADLRLLIEVLTKGQGDLKNLNRDLKRTGDEAEKASGQIGNIGKTLGAFAGGFVAFKALDFLGDATNAAAEFNDTISASGVILGDEALPELEKWADGAAEAFGASKQQALDAANTFAVFGKSAGLAGDDLATFSTDLTELAGDLASFRGGTTQEAIDAISSALRGESEPIRRYGVLLDEATLKQRALKEGIVKTTKDALTPQQKVLAAQAEIFAQTADAQGDYARTADEMANTQRELAAKLDNVTIEIGQKLIPIMLDLANFVIDDVIPALEGLFGLLNDVSGAINNFRAGADLLTGPLGDTTKQMQDLGDAGAKIPERLEGAGSASDSLRTNLRELGDTEVDLEPTMTEAVRDITDAVTLMGEELGKAPGEMADALLANQYVLTGEGGAIQQLVDFMEQSLTPAQQMMNAQGFLQSQELADGLVSNNPYVALKAQEMQAAAIEALKANLYLAMDAGMNLASTYAAGIVNNLGVVQDAGRRLAQNAARPITIESEPPDRQSALYGITKWGGNIARTLAEGMSGAVSLVSTASRGLASAIVPGTLDGFSVAPGAIPDGTQTAGAGGIHIHLYNMGDPITEDDDVLESLRLLVPHIRDAALGSHG